MTRVHDKLDWHLDDALSAGRPEENAFAHIGLYLAWLVRNDLASADYVRADWVAAIKRGEMTGSDLAGALDGVLASDMMTTEGRAFTDSYYPAYAEDFGETFATAGEYGVTDDAAAFALIAPVIEQRFQRWLSEGRPGRSSADDGTATVPPEVVDLLSGISAEELASIREQVESIAAEMQDRCERRASWPSATTAAGRKAGGCRS